MRPYRPSYVFSIPGVLLLAAAAVIGGLAIGGATLAVSRLIYIPLMMPVLMGLGGAGVLTVAIKKARMPNRFLALLFGLLIGVTTYATLNYGEYLLFQREQITLLKEDYQASYPDLTDQDYQDFLDFLLEEETGTPGFPGYLHWTAITGVTFVAESTYGPPDESGLTITGPWVWLYWGIELLIICAISAFATFGSAPTTLCSQCRQWYADPVYLNYVPGPFAPSFLELLRNGALEEAAKLISPTAGAGAHYLTVQTRSCPNCPEADVILQVRRLSPGRQGRVTTRNVFQGLMTPEEHASFLRAIRTDR